MEFSNIQKVNTCDNFAIVKAVKMVCPECKKVVFEEYHKHMSMVSCYHCLKTFLCFPTEADNKKIEIIKEISKINDPMVYGYDKQTKHYYFSTKECWEKDKCCSDHMAHESYSALSIIDFSMETDGVWSDPSERAYKKVKKILDEIGFEYNKKFEDFMMDHEED